MLFFFFQAEDGIRDYKVTGVQTCALPICSLPLSEDILRTISKGVRGTSMLAQLHLSQEERSEEHTSELQSPCNLVCRLLLEKKKKKKRDIYICNVVEESEEYVKSNHRRET